MLNEHLIKNVVNINYELDNSGIFKNINYCYPKLLCTSIRKTFTIEQKTK